MSNRTLTMTDPLYDYLLKNSLRESEVAKALRERTLQEEWSRMQIAPEQGQFMALLVELIGAKKIIEIGTFTGYSALCMAQALPDEGKIVCCDISEEWTKIGEEFWQKAGIRDKIDLQIAPALDTLHRLLDNKAGASFDLVFIDADKTNYSHYYSVCLELVRPGGVILFDNTLWDGAVADPEKQDDDTIAIRELNRILLKDERISLSLLPLGDGLSLVRKRA